jgi:hypothetical protein
MATNPFNITKAVDFSDEQIANTWVDFGSEGGFYSFAAPTSPMPRVLVGGKGSGRTHLMRYYSAPLQRIRAGDDPIRILDDGYLGIYLRCSGLNATRFSGKGIDDDAWDAVFAYYMDLWLAQLAISTAQLTLGRLPGFHDAERAVTDTVISMLDDLSGVEVHGLTDLHGTLHALQRELDLAVNNAALTRRLDGVLVRSAPGQLPLTVPRAMARHFTPAGGLIWLYLLDELENLTERQQWYVQTLLREKELPTSFMVGARSYGFRTTKTLSADEENREGSEFELRPLDGFFLQHKTAFAQFCRSLVAQRLIEQGTVLGQRDELAGRLDSYFYTTKPRDTSFVLERERERERPYFVELKRQLTTHTGLRDADADRIVQALRAPEDPVLEKLNVLLLYQRWNAGKDLGEEAVEIQSLCRADAEGRPGSYYRQKLSHHGNDMYAQLLRQYRRQQRYLGLDAFISMAGGLPRNLLIILKNVFRWADFNGEQPFGGETISERSQRDGVQESAAWFFKDNLPLGEQGRRVEAAIDRVGGLLRVLRFADRPPEIDLCAFSVDASRLSARGQDTLQAAEEWSLLIRIAREQRDRNDGSLVDKFRLNPMLCPHFDLPLAMGGTLRLSVAEGEAVFGESDDWDELRRVRVNRANVPFGRTDDTQGRLELE